MKYLNYNIARIEIKGKTSMAERRVPRPKWRRFEAAISASWRFHPGIADIGESDAWQREDFDRARRIINCEW